MWRGLLPFVLALVLFVVAFRRIEWAAFARQVAAANYPAFIAFMALFVAGLLAADTLGTVYVYRRSLPQLRYRDFFVMRGASYLPSLLNHHLGQAWLTYQMAEVFSVDLRRMAGATLLVYVSWGGCILGLACVGVVATGLPAGWLLLPLGAGLLYLLLLTVSPARLAKTKLLAPLFEAGVRGHLLAMLTRLPHLAVLFLGTWLPFLFFDVHIPVGSALAYVPILMVAITIPITPQGWGTRDALAATFFASFASSAEPAEQLAAVAAATTSTAAALMLIEATIGLIMLRIVRRIGTGPT